MCTYLVCSDCFLYSNLISSGHCFSVDFGFFLFVRHCARAQIAGIMASFGGGIARESVFVQQYEEKFTQMLSGNE